MIQSATQQRDIFNMADELVNNPAMLGVAAMVRQELHLVNEEQILGLRRHLALAYAQGYIRGRDDGRRRLVAPPPLPAPLRPK